MPGAYRTSRVPDRQIDLADYQGAIRQITITDLGEEQGCETAKSKHIFRDLINATGQS